jgi:hypothetical protein
VKHSSLAVVAAAAVLAVVPGAQAKAPPSGVDFCGAGRSRLVEVDGWVHKIPWRVANLALRGLP